MNLLQQLIAHKGGSQRKWSKLFNLKSNRENTHTRFKREYGIECISTSNKRENNNKLKCTWTTYNTHTHTHIKIQWSLLPDWLLYGHLMYISNNHFHLKVLNSTYTHYTWRPAFILFNCFPYPAFFPPQSNVTSHSNLFERSKHTHNQNGLWLRKTMSKNNKRERTEKNECCCWFSFCFGPMSCICSNVNILSPEPTTQQTNNRSKKKNSLKTTPPIAFK